MDNFDLKKFLKESRALENLNPILRKGKLDENNLRSKIKEMIIAELGDPDYSDYDEMEDMPNIEDEDYESVGVYGDNYDDDFDPRLMESDPEDYEEDNYDYSNDYYDHNSYDSNDFGDTDEFDGYGGYDIGEAKKKEEDVEDVETTDAETEEVPAEDAPADEAPSDEAPAEEAPAADGGGLEDIAADMEGTEGDLMDHLMAALKVAKGMNNEKLTTQIGNTLKFFVSEYIGGEEQ